MKQTTFSDIEYSNRRRKNRREQFLDLMDSMIPWESWLGWIRPFYPSGKRGRPPKDMEMMLRMYLLQKWFGFSAKGIEDAIYDSYAMRRFMGLDFLHEQVPGTTTLLRFRRLMEDHGLDKRILKDLADRLEKKGLTLRPGLIADPSVVAAPAAAKKEIVIEGDEGHNSSAVEYGQL